MQLGLQYVFQFPAFFRIFGKFIHTYVKPLWRLTVMHTSAAPSQQLPNDR